MLNFDNHKLESIAIENFEKFNNAKPFSHLVIDDFLPLEEVNKIAHNFPEPNQIKWSAHGSGANADNEKFKGIKLQCQDESQFPESIKDLLQEFNSQSFLYFLKKLSGVEYIVGDPYYNGCGMHSTGNGGRLMVHADVNRYPYPALADQFLNCIFYVTPEWDAEWGGELELWDEKVKNCVKSITPKFNRLLIFKTDRKCFHGHPHPIKCPENKRRNSIAAYFYIPNKSLKTNSSQIQTILWQRTNALDKKFSRKFLLYVLYSFVFDFAPPILLRKIRELKIFIKQIINK